MARPTKGLDHVDGLQGDVRTKGRLKALLATITGEAWVATACETIGVGPTQFANLRSQALQGALDALQPRRVGRPPKPSSHTDAEYRALQQRNVELEREVALLKAQLEVARMPVPAAKERSKRPGQSSLRARTP